MSPTAADFLEQRVISADELRRFAVCPLAWWYDRTHPLAAASAGELSRRLDLFEAVYGPGASDLPEYHLLAHLRDAANAITPDQEMTEKAEPITPFERPRRLYLLVILIVGVVAALIVAGIILALAQP